MTQQITWLTEVEATRFDEFLTALWSYMRESDVDVPEVIPDGIGEVMAAPWPMGYAIDKRARFAAFRWHLPSPPMASASHIRYEAFFVCPASTAPKLAVRAFLAGTPPSEPIRPPQWWTQTLGLPDEIAEELLLPGFIELVALLASQGSIATSSADTQSAITALEYEVDYYRQLSEEQADELRQLRATLREQWANPPKQSDFDKSTEEESNDEEIRDLSGLPAWALQQGDRITVLPRALNGAKKSIYENPSTVYAALELLAGPYREYRLGSLDKTGFSEALAASGLQLAGSVGASIAGEQGDTYFVNWHGRRRFLDFHLLKGGGRDERYCLRVYFFWDDELKQAVVGWLPSHLNNSLS